MFDPEHKGTKILRNIGKYSPKINSLVQEIVEVYYQRNEYNILARKRAGKKPLERPRRKKRICNVGTTTELRRHNSYALQTFPNFDGF